MALKKERHYQGVNYYDAGNNGNKHPVSDAGQMPSLEVTAHLLNLDKVWIPSEFFLKAEQI